MLKLSKIFFWHIIYRRYFNPNLQVRQGEDALVSLGKSYLVSAYFCQCWLQVAKRVSLIMQSTCNGTQKWFKCSLLNLMACLFWEQPTEKPTWQSQNLAKASERERYRGIPFGNKNKGIVRSTSMTILCLLIY